MQKRSYAFFATLAMLVLASLACQYTQPILIQPTLASTTEAPAAPSVTVTPLSPMPDVPGMQPFKLTGTLTVTNDYTTAILFVEHAVALIDMHGFVIRDPQWELPIDSQVLGHLKLNADKKSGEYTLFLPQRPQGIYNDVDNDGLEDTGLQIFAVSYFPNLTGSPFAEGDDKIKGWPTYLASIRTDSENMDEVTGGKLVVWSPDDQQHFPSGFGSDGLLFTADDPVGLIPAGYSVVNLDEDPFSLSTAPEEALTLYEPSDVAEKDFSSLSYTEAFDKMFEIISKEYAFNGMAGKQPDWDKLYSELRPRIAEAERARDGLAFTQAIRDFIWAFKDGHVGIFNGNYAYEDYSQFIGGGFGFIVRELDNNKAISTYIMPNGPAENAGMQAGAEIIEFNGQPIKDAIGAVKPSPYSLQSSEFAYRLEQARFLVRAPVGTEASVTFKTPGGSVQTVLMRAIEEYESYDRSAPNYTDEPAPILPVDSRIITQAGSEIGYIRVNSNYDDLNLIVRLFERALKEFEARNVEGVIIDMRTNGGGAPLGLAGFLTGQEITLGQLEYFSDKTGQFEPEGEVDRFRPTQEQYSFNNLVTLVGPNCVSACELESYGFSQVPGMIVVGQYPTAGVEAEVSRGQFKLPEGIQLQIPTGRFTLPDGSIFLEGQGVQPTVHVPINESSALSKDDVVLQYGIDAVLKPAGQGIKPVGPPKLDGNADNVIRAANEQGANDLESYAREQYSRSDLEEMNRVFDYTIAFSESRAVLWSSGWCADSEALAVDNFKQIKIDFTLDGEKISTTEFALLTSKPNNKTCISYYALLTDWPGGEHHLQTVFTIASPINDGQKTYPAGTQTYNYTVIVKP